MRQRVLFYLLAAMLSFAAALNLTAQGTAFSYQGQLSASGAPANTNYDFRFAVFTAPTNGTLVSGWETNFNVPVSNGLFSVAIDFGPGIFNGTLNGSNDWLDVSVRATGTTSFTALVPRQPILPVPYALFATSASNLLGTLQATQLVGSAASSLISGMYTNVVNFGNSSNMFTGAFTGNGLNLTNLNASHIASGTLSNALLSPDVALTDRNQTFSATNTFSGPVNSTGTNSFAGPNTFSGTNAFTGVNTISNSGNIFAGSFFGNGLVGWVPVSGTAVTAARDHGYMLTNAGLTTVTLPATTSLTNGDIVRVSGGSGGGWLVQVASGQTITGNFAAYANGTLTSLGSSGYGGVAASADGVRMYAVGGGVYPNGFTGVFASSDGGKTWNQVGATTMSAYCSSIACSANGKVVYAQVNTGGVSKSTDSGNTWASVGAGTVNNFISCTANGGTLITGNVACSGNGTYRAKLASGAITISTDGGVTFPVTLTGTPSGITCLACSSDCTRIVVGVSNGLLYASSNRGGSWTTLTTSNQAWSGAWMAADGSKFAASIGTSGGITGSIGYCNVSPLPNTSCTTSTGTICGSQGSAVELQFIGNGQFTPASSTGLIWAN